MNRYHLPCTAWCLLGGVLLLTLVSACRPAVNFAEPPEIVYGQDVCDECNMIISDAHFAAAYWRADGQARRFDDLGGMFLYHQEHQEEVAAFWVHDYLSGNWLPATDAYYVVGAGLPTPMGFGMVACATQAQAHALAYGQAEAEVLNFATLMARLQENTLELGPEQHQHQHGG